MDVCNKIWARGKGVRGKINRLRLETNYELMIWSLREIKVTNTGFSQKKVTSTILGFHTHTHARTHTNTHWRSPWEGETSLIKLPIFPSYSDVLKQVFSSSKPNTHTLSFSPHAHTHFPTSTTGEKDGLTGCEWEQLSAAPMTGFFCWRGLIQQRALELHSFSAGMQRRDAFHFVFKRRYRYTVRSHMPSWRKTQKNVLVWSAILHVVELCVLVYSRVHLKFCQIRTRFCILAYFSWRVVPALCQIMYSLSVCSDETTSAAPRSFRQNRPPARTLSLT